MQMAHYKLTIIIIIIIIFLQIILFDIYFLISKGFKTKCITF